MEKNNQETITAREKAEIEELGKAVEHLSLEKCENAGKKFQTAPGVKIRLKKMLVTCA